ncbi:hypothetical protein BVRB_040570, partial [Beta vulgaris subsp. vulgaris]
ERLEAVRAALSVVEGATGIPHETISSYCDISTVDNMDAISELLISPTNKMKARGVAVRRKDRMPIVHTTMSSVILTVAELGPTLSEMRQVAGQMASSAWQFGNACWRAGRSVTVFPYNFCRELLGHLAEAPFLGARAASRLYLHWRWRLSPL